MKKVFATAMMCLLLSACESSWSGSEVKLASTANDGAASQETQRQPTAASDILLTESDIIDRPYTVIGDIDATVNKTTIFNRDPTREMVAAELKKKAAELGADAVILVRYGSVGTSFFSWGSLNGKGRAVAFVK